MLYIPISTVENAEFLSRQLYKLTRSVRDPSDVTEFYCAWHVHPQSGAVVVALPESEMVPVHVAADPTLLDQPLQPFVQQGAITEADVQAVRDAIIASQGQQTSLLPFIPAFWAAQAKTREQLDSEGWFPSPDEQGVEYDPEWFPETTELS